MGLFTDIIAPAVPVLAKMEARGIPLDVQMRDELRKEARLVQLESKVWLSGQTFEYHKKRRGRLQDLMELLMDERGRLDRKDAHRKDFSARIQKCRTRLKQIGDSFDAENDNHWRSLLFDKEVGFGLDPVRLTDSGKPSVEAEAIRLLSKQYPENEFLRHRLRVQEATIRLRSRLAVEPDGRGRVHFAYSFHRTGTGRLSSGADAQEEGKERESEGGNAQNLADRDRRMFCAEPGFVLLQLDWSQIEARVQAWLAQDRKLLEAYRAGMDVHSMAASALFGVPIEEVESRTMWFEGAQRSYRHVAKKWRHGRNYGMGAKKASEMYGISRTEAERLEKADDEMWPEMAAFREREIAEVLRTGMLTNPFGRTAAFKREKRAKGWIVGEREEALAFRPQSTVGDMCKAMLPRLEQIALEQDAELLATVHDSFLFQVDERLWRVLAVTVKEACEREWPELGEIKGFGYFRCPADLMMGKNWGEAKEQNPYGLKEVEIAA
jgi:DNA polymerase-1